MKKIARINAILCVVISAVCLFFFILFGSIVKDGMVYRTEEKPTPYLFLFAGITVATLIVGLLHLGVLTKKPGKVKTIVLTSLSFVVFVVGLVLSILFGIGKNVNGATFVTIGYIEFAVSFLFLIPALLTGIFLPILVKKGYLLD